MGLSLHLAYTYQEILSSSHSPAHTAFMACHFSSYGQGLEMPPDIPPCSLLILNDRIPVWNHDPKLVAAQLKEYSQAFHCDAILLDFQHPCPQAAVIAKEIQAELPLPVGATEYYAKELDGPIFLPPLPHRQRLSSYIAPWKGREIWLDIAADAERIVVTKDGTNIAALPNYTPEGVIHHDNRLHCSYQTTVTEDQAVFSLFRSNSDLRELLDAAQELGITRAIGLYQELKTLLPL